MADLTSERESQSERSEDESISATINYLTWLAAEDLTGTNLRIPLNAETSLQWFCQTLRPPLLDVLKSRYALLAGIDAAAMVFPAEQLLVEKVLIPLHQAKVAFVLGHELGCIALCGMVAEMLATLRFQVSEHGCGPKVMTESRQRRLFGRSFEEIEHSRRVGFLELLGLINLATGDLFKEMSGIRNKYLHRLSQPHAEMSKDALRSYQITVALSISVLGLGFLDGRATLNGEVLAYIKSRQAAGGSMSSANE
jgi:hypothetical protein